MVRQRHGTLRHALAHRLYQHHDPEAVRLLQDAFTLSKSLGGLVVDENSRVELKEAMVSGMANGYETFYNLCNSAISFRITGIKETKSPPDSTLVKASSSRTSVKTSVSTTR